MKTVATQCATQTQIDFSKIDTCMKNSLGNQLEHQYALQTDQLQPAHKYVPWVTVNGVHTEVIQREAQRNLVALICKTYKVKQLAYSEKKEIHIAILGSQSTGSMQETSLNDSAVLFLLQNQ